MPGTGRAPAGASHGAQLVDGDARQREQAVLDRAHDLAGDVQRAAREQVVRLVDAARSRVLDRQQREVRGAVEHGIGRGAERVEPGEQCAARATAVAALRRQVAIAALDTLVRDAQRCVGPVAHRRLLVRDRQVHDHAVQSLDLVRIEPGTGRMVTQPQQQALLALAIAERARGLELRERDLLDDAQPLG